MRRNAVFVVVGMVTAAASGSLQAQTANSASVSGGMGGAQYGGGASASGGKLHGSFRLLNYPQVQKDLGLTADQLAALKAGNDRFRNAEKSAFAVKMKPGHVKEGVQQREQALAQATARASHELSGILTVDQSRRLWQIRLQEQGGDALLDPDVAKALKLAPEQIEKLNRIHSEVDDQILARVAPQTNHARAQASKFRKSSSGRSGGGFAGGGGGAGAGGGGASRRNDPVIASNQAVVASLIRNEKTLLESVLTPEQQARFKELQGPRCELPPHYVGRSIARSGGGSSYGGAATPPR